MKKSKLLPALAIATAAAAGLSLPLTASADPFRHAESTVVRGDHGRDSYARPVHDMERRHGPIRFESRHHDRGHHYGQRHKHVHRHGHPPVERYEYRYEPRPVVRYEPRYEPRHDSDVRVRISYDLHL